MTEVLAETQPVGVLAACPDCGHAHHAHRGADITGNGFAVCLAAIPVKRSGEPPAFGEYTTGQGRVHDISGSVCSCNRCRCPRCEAAVAAHG